MDQSTRDKIAESAVEVFGTMYFMPIELLVEVPDKETREKGRGCIAAQISFKGPISAVVRFYFTDRIVQKISEGFLGVDAEEVSKSQAFDTMKEAANMVIGSFLGKADPAGSCQLGIPAAEMVEDFTPEGLEEEGEVLVFLSEFGFLWMTYRD